MEKYLTKKSRKEGENFRISRTDVFTNIFYAFPKSTLKENKNNQLLPNSNHNNDKQME